jgi:hypothetical protein
MKKRALVVEDVRLERVRIAFPCGLTVQQALEAGMLISGVEVVANPDLRVLAKDRLDQYGVEWTRASRRRELRPGLTPSRAAHHSEL